MSEKWKQYIENILESRGYCIKRMSYVHSYDFLANNNIKINVKVSNLYKNIETEYHCFDLEKEYHSCDIYILIALDGAGSSLKILIIPAKNLMGQNQIIIKNKSKYDKFDSRFELIKIYDNFYNDLDCVI
ncbi:hypothetical protein KGF51_18270 [Clostridioides sp. ZZV14-6045]|uniref:hypothetical protein n=1 Tax=unclassified Clostridioides TaxID=2635829 RepID=UPI001D10D99E|nr:hypothetical protein [Clostridioides sp. ZZV14-6045]MCC0732616.1 hypothetical protein [Clostridioides sp. ZZV14-6048]